MEPALEREATRRPDAEELEDDNLLKLSIIALENFQGFFMYSGRISNCYDSHSHLLATGEVQMRLNLRGLKDPDQVSELIVRDHHKKGSWLVGFGYDESSWNQKPHRRFLDQAFPKTPVVFSRCDGHVYWVNTQALREMGWLSAEGQLKVTVPSVVGGEIPVGIDGVPTGVFVDAAKLLVEPHIPKDTASETKGYLMAGMRVFRENGFTHVRDMSCSEMQWNELLKLEASGLLTLAIEQTFSAETPEQFEEALDLARRAIKVPLKKIRPQAIKVYYDGALGSEGALLSQPYQTSKDTYGLQLLTQNQLLEFMRRSWELPLDFAVHTIGDRAADDVVNVAVELWEQGVKGCLHLEHAEVMRPETIQKLKGRKSVCHLQPCHWLTDHIWLKQKLGALTQYAFPWATLQEWEVPFYFGSDSPISRPSINDNFEALAQSQKQGIAPLKGRGDIYHSHPDHDWVSNTFTVFQDGLVKEVVFEGTPIYQQSDHS